MSRARLVVLVSGNGTNLQALLDACAADTLAADVVAVVSNRQKAYGLQRAQAAGVPAHALTRKRFATRAAYDAALADLIQAWRPDLVVLAGWMHILGAAFLARFEGRVLNLHPALPGQFPGTDAIARAWQAARRGEISETGVMIHVAVPQVDAGPVIAQETVPIDADAELCALEAAVHAVEHRLIVEAVRRFTEHHPAAAADGSVPNPPRCEQGVAT